MAVRADIGWRRRRSNGLRGAVFLKLPVWLQDDVGRHHQPPNPRFSGTYLHALQQFVFWLILSSHIPSNRFGRQFKHLIHANVIAEH